MKKRRIRMHIANSMTLSIMGMALAGCGLEAVVSEAFDGSNETPATRISGTSSLSNATYTVVAADDSVLEPMELTVDGNSYDIVLPSGTYRNLRVQAAQGDLVLSKVVWRTPPAGENPAVLALLPESAYSGDAFTLDVDAHAATLLIRGWMQTTRVEEVPLPPVECVTECVNDCVTECTQTSSVSGPEECTTTCTNTCNTACSEPIPPPPPPAEFTLVNMDPTVIRGIYVNLYEGFSVSGPLQDYRDMIARVVDAASTSNFGTPAFQIPIMDAVTSSTGDTSYSVNTVPINPDWLSEADIDIDGDGMADTSTTVIGDMLAAAVDQIDETVTLEGCFDTDRIRVVFEVDFNEGRLDGNCVGINRFRWVQDEPGKQMFFVGGIHEDSLFQDPEVDAVMGNTGGWTPNRVPMYDDGTNGDEVAGDNIWTISFVVPRGAMDAAGNFVPTRLGYKYTWGKFGQLWTGTEEWPGNQHILELVDQNGDDIIRRRDNFGDEASNKDKANLNRRAGQIGGELGWDTDLNEDTIPDTHENPLDLNFDCRPNEYVTPANIGRATVDCLEVE